MSAADASHRQHSTETLSPWRQRQEHRRRRDVLRKAAEAKSYTRPRLPTTSRPYLCCKKSFRSEGKHNRLCNNCRGITVYGDVHD